MSHRPPGVGITSYDCLSGDLITAEEAIRRVLMLRPSAAGWLPETRRRHVNAEGTVPQAAARGRCLISWTIVVAANALARGFR
jgi:hypothetical protein